MAEQLTLDFESHSEQLRRVKSKTAEAILQFFGTLGAGETFHAQQLRDYVASIVPVAPSSPDRVMRDMRTCGQLRYELVSRKDSLYRVV